MSITHVWFSFSGRINRSIYWLWYFLPWIVLAIVTSILDSVLGTQFETSAGPIGIISSLFGLFMIWVGLAVGAKRLHDRDRSGWWQLLYFVPILGALFLFVYLGFLKGSDGANRFGPDPLGGETDWSSDSVPAE